MTEPRYYGFILGYRARKRLGSRWGLRTSYFHPETGFYRHPQDGGYVYRVVAGVQQKYFYRSQHNPRRVNQMNWREVHSNGVITAQALTVEERIPYALRAKGSRKGWWFNIFLSDWLHLWGPPLHQWGYQRWEQRKWL